MISYTSLKSNILIEKLKNETGLVLMTTATLELKEKLLQTNYILFFHAYPVSDFVILILNLLNLTMGNKNQ